MPNTFDPYREALVIETKTVWPEDLPGAPQDESERERIEERLHADPAQPPNWNTSASTPASSARSPSRRPTWSGWHPRDDERPSCRNVACRSLFGE